MEYRDRSAPHIVIMYVLIAILAAFLIYTGMRVLQMPNRTDFGSWQCASAVCAQYTDPQQWVAKNCAHTIAPNGTDYLACTVNLSGQSTSIPLSLINLTYVSQQCAVATCVQEVNVRSVNYTIPVTGSPGK